MQFFCWTFAKDIPYICSDDVNSGNAALFKINLIFSLKNQGLSQTIELSETVLFNYNYLIRNFVTI